MAQRQALAYAWMTQNHEQLVYAVESVDPDWTDHYGDVIRAFDDYWDSSKEEMIIALVESFK